MATEAPQIDAPGVTQNQLEQQQQQQAQLQQEQQLPPQEGAQKDQDQTTADTNEKGDVEGGDDAAAADAAASGPSGKKPKPLKKVANVLKALFGCLRKPAVADEQKKEQKEQNAGDDEAKTADAGSGEPGNDNEKGQGDGQLADAAKEGAAVTVTGAAPQA
ncbi:hypothetical protein VTH06DRAFT_4043 [Thermothelomyces fergusii]